MMTAMAIAQSAIPAEMMTEVRSGLTPAATVHC
jgi:hypothetical protein